MNAPHWIGIDWGTTHRRAWYFIGDQVHARHADTQGVLACAPRFAEALQHLLQTLEAPADTPVVMAGMIGSATGWQEVPYLDANCPLDEWAHHRVPVRGHSTVSIVPGCRWINGDEVDVMRGEETQLLGAWAIDPADGWYVLPGTHSKWVELRQGRVVQLHTYMSGELYALLSQHGTLAPLIAAGADADPLQHREAYARGVRAARRRALAHELFGCRAQVVTGRLAREEAGAYLSGLLLGAEWHEALARGLPAQEVVRIIGSPALARLHQQTAVQVGAAALALDVEAVQLAAWRTLRAAVTATAKEMPA